MRIEVSGENERHIRITVPTGLLLNRLTASVVASSASKRGISLTQEQTVKLIRLLDECRKRYADWKIVEIETSDGEYIEITL